MVASSSGDVVVVVSSDGVVLMVPGSGDGVVMVVLVKMMITNLVRQMYCDVALFKTAVATSTTVTLLIFTSVWLAYVTLPSMCSN